VVTPGSGYLCSTPPLINVFYIGSTPPLINVFYIGSGYTSGYLDHFGGLMCC